VRVDAVPVMLEGVSQATATGIATLKLDREEELMVVTVDVPNLIARLPQASSREVVQLGDNPQSRWRRRSANRKRRRRIGSCPGVSW